MAESNGASSRPEEAAADNTLALNPVVGFDTDDIVKAGVNVARQALLQPAIGMEHATRLWQESVRILFGASDTAPDPKDARFRDPAFSENGFFKRVAQGWVAAERTVHEWVDAVGFDDIGRQRAHFVLGLVADGLVPTNFLLGNPSALKKARETRGQSLVKGTRNFVDDLLHNGGMPSQVDKTPFKVGGNLANTEGSVVLRHPILELIQYRPRMPNVETRPVFIVPPQINKYLRLRPLAREEPRQVSCSTRGSRCSWCRGAIRRRNSAIGVWPATSTRSKRASKRRARSADTAALRRSAPAPVGSR